MTTTTDQHEARCLRPGCGRKLTSKASVAAGYGPTCLRKIREAAVAEARADFTADQQAKADELIRDGGAVEIAPGLYEMSASDGEHTYACDGRSCVCDAGWSDKRCYHLLVARVLDITSRRPAAPRTAPVSRVTVPSRDIWAELEAAGALDPIPAF